MKIYETTLELKLPDFTQFIHMIHLCYTHTILVPFIPHPKNTKKIKFINAYAWQRVLKCASISVIVLENT